MLVTSIRLSKIMLFASSLIVFVVTCRGQTATTSASAIYAQQVVSETLAAHPELVGFEVAGIPPGETQCVTIASSEPKGIGEKCDKDEFGAMRTNKPFVEKEKENGREVYDVTVPIHDVDGRIIATAGLDFKPEPGQNATQVRERSQKIAREVESKIKSKEMLFQEKH